MKSYICLMVKLKTKNREYTIEFLKNDFSSGNLNGKKFDWDIVKIKENSYHIIKNHRSYSAEILNFNSSNKTITVKVNGHKHEFKISDRYDEVLHEMGLDTLATIKITELRAPMPGMVIEICAKAGQQIKTGDKLLVLEAMKMENILKSPVDGIIKKVNIKTRDTVEKNSILLTFE